ncbi:MAG: hypothetical protein R3F59_04255 [Myxococcota bacterium]
MKASEQYARFQPPDGYVSLPSALEGIEVYGPDPAAKEAAAEGPTAVRCPGCGAAARFDVAKGRVGCAFCGWTDDADQASVGEAGAFTRAALDRGSEGFGVDRRELSCGGCGAVLALEAGALAATCPFCASPQVSVREHATVQGLRPTALLPFAVLDTAARQAAKAWLGQGWFHPGDLMQLASVDRFLGIYVPYWAFSAAVAAGWEAEVGRERTVTRRNAQGETETETVIDWSWQSGEVALRIDDLLVSGTTKLPARQLARLEPGLTLDAIVGYAPKLLAGFQAQTYDVGLPAAWDAGRAKMRERAREACMRDTGSSHVRSFSMTADLNDEQWRHLLLPLWVSAYRYGGRSFAVLVDGVGGAVAGQKPVAWWKVWTAVALMLSPGVLSAIVGIPLLIVGIGAAVLLVAAILLVAGGIGSAVLVAHARDLEAA